MTTACSEMLWFTLPEKRDGRDKAVANAGFLDSRLSDEADKHHMQWEAAERCNISLSYQLSVGVKALQPLLVQVCCDKEKMTQESMESAEPTDQHPGHWQQGCLCSLTCR